MTAIIKTEFQKMKRYHILLIALIGMFLFTAASAFFTVCHERCIKGSLL